MYNAATDVITDLLETMVFNIDGQEGSSLEPTPFTFLANPTHTAQVEQPRLLVQPNPFRSSTHVYFQAASAGGASVSIVDALGRVVEQFDMDAFAGWNDFAWRADGLATGVYFIRVEMRDALLVEKVVLE